MADEELNENDQTEETAGRGRGAGLRLGLLLGILAGVALAVLLSHDSQTEEAPASPERYGEPETPIATLRLAIDQLRGRVREASQEAQHAARAAEERMTARYEELTKN
jgi:hypothetical protein